MNTGKNYSKDEFETLELNEILGLSLASLSASVKSSKSPFSWTENELYVIPMTTESMFLFPVVHCRPALTDSTWVEIPASPGQRSMDPQAGPPDEPHVEPPLKGRSLSIAPMSLIQFCMSVTISSYVHDM